MTNLYSYFLIESLNHYGDILAIPFFALSIYYFYTIENRNTMENLLLFFSVSGFILDIIFTYIFLSMLFGSRRRQRS
jgi:hypothetical protein